MSRMPIDLSKQQDPTGKDIFSLILEEHRLVEKLGNQYQSSNDINEKQGIAHNILKLLCLHAACEEMALYPVMRLKLPNGEALVNHALKEHQQVKKDLLVLDNMTVHSAHFDELLLKTLAEVEQHVKEEETELLPSLRKVCNSSDIANMTSEFITSKKIAPPRPHPDAPNRPPENKHANAVAAAEDAVRDAGRFSSAS